MSAEPVESLIRRILKQYNKRPQGWSVLTDRKGNVLVLGPGTAYKLRLIPINPNEYTGVGIKIDGLRDIRRVLGESPSYGFRPLSDTETNELLNVNHQKRPSDKLIRKVLELKPVSTRELRRKRSKVVLSGPIMVHPNLSVISTSQKELEAKLAFEADKLFRMKYPGRAAFYN